MNKFNRLKNKSIARLASSIPAVANYLTASYTPQASVHIPWSPIKKSLIESKIALVTTTGVHHSHQEPFDMDDPAGDPTYRKIDIQTIEDDYLITHDYYDHRDADKDLNIVFPVTRLKEMATKKIVGSVARHHFSFMGHIKGSHLDNLLETHAPQVATRLVQDQIDVVLLTPG